MDGGGGWGGDGSGAHRWRRASLLLPGPSSSDEESEASQASGYSHGYADGQSPLPFGESASPSNLLGGPPNGHPKRLPHERRRTGDAHLACTHVCTRRAGALTRPPVFDLVVRMLMHSHEL